MKKILAIIALFGMGMMQARYSWEPMDAPIESKEDLVIGETYDVEPESIEKEEGCSEDDPFCHH